MTNSVDDRTPVSRKDVLVKYLQHYDRVSSEGNVKVCSDRQVTDEGRRVLMSEEEPRKRFNTLDLYLALYECVKYTDYQRYIQGFIKATELLEMFCVNLFLFPWKKEIKTLKTFTGHFVYYIKPILPFAKSILQSIGYCIESDTEYRLSDSVDPDKAKKMGFDLFLARLECEYLLELMGKKSHVECLEILQIRAAPLNPSAEDDVPGHTSICIPNEDVLQEDKHVEGGSLVNPEEQQRQTIKTYNPHDQENLETQDSTITDVERPSSSFMADDKSILEMKENYPDLAIRQKPIFRKSQKKSTQPLKAKELVAFKGYSTALFPEVNTDMSGPQSIAMHSETTPSNNTLHIPNAVVEAQCLDDKPLVLRVETVLQGCKCEGPQENCLVDRTEQMGKMHKKELCVDEPLKYPIEETTQAQLCNRNNVHVTAPPTKTQVGMSSPILCSQSQELICNIEGCRSCAVSDAVPGQDNTIKEPPQSIYIPSSPLPSGPPTDHHQTGNEGSNSQLHRSPTSQQPDDDITKTYVML
ncbi:LOW QUALITY PROTEIN: uncharacterized protein si:ch211-189a15.5 [Triplophysa dalaica]|uniref:LOW QUALITY PROTEIN: uncharacterized protein si:ch211-189a15.5 n=1 Tax=Triplophysa dalaica TaxID=1582913 RepID=UPI0024E010DD|nr:LOW QUALITY PROTEIN: uncharacterized protein si:ch211-189a15.5 [Triplophysa dalaica]